MRSSVLCGLSVSAYLLGTRPAAAELTLVDKDGWTFYTNGRINAFFSQAIGDDFPPPTPNPNVNGAGNAPGHDVVGNGQPFTAGYVTTNQANANNKYIEQRVRSGFLATVTGFGIKRKVSETTTANGYVALWGTAQTFARDRTQDMGRSTSKGFDVRAGWLQLEGPWGSVRAGRQDGVFGGISTEIDYLYGHNYGLGLPCVDDYYASCGHIGTGALGPGFAAGFVYTTPSFSGFKLQAALFDPVRLLGAWLKVNYPRPEGTLSFEQRVSPTVMFKLVAEGMYQPMGNVGSDQTTQVWGVSGGGRLEAGPIRFGASVFRGTGLGAYVAIQNASSSFDPKTNELRSFTGLYAQSAFVFGPAQISFGVGRVTADQLEADKVNTGISNLKSQTGISLAFYYHINDYLVLGVDYFRFQSDWWGAPNARFTDDTGSTTELLPGYLAGEKQVLNFINAGATFHW